MRKALIGLIVAATALTPVAAFAQRGHRGGDAEDRAEQRAERIQQRNEARQQRQEQQQQQQSQPQSQPQQQVALNDRRGGDGNRGGNRGNDGNRGGGGGDNGNRNWRGNDGQNDGNRNRRGGEGRGREQQPSIYPQAWQGDPNDPRLRNYQRLERQNQQRYGNDGRRGDRNWRDNDGRGDRDWRNDRRGDRRDWDRSWRNDRRYDWRSWRNSNRNIFRGSRYYSPYRNWGYNRFSIGIFLEPLFYSNRYWIGDPWQYRLPPAYPGTQWVRYYNDVLLVDVYTGEVLDVIHDFFW